MTDAHAFRHCPMLHGKIQDPATSRFRRMEERYDQLDAEMAAIGREDWRLSHADREATRREALQGREGADLWIFGYGSLIWDPAVHFDEVRRATATGFRRRFCIHLEGGRGSPERPGLMASLDRAEGHICDGVALRLPASVADGETRVMWMREMITGAYVPAFIPLATPQGPIEALAFLVKHGDERYCDCGDAEAARRIAFAEGSLGTNLDYLAQLVEHLGTLDIEDPEMTDLLAACLALRAEAGAQ
ncbi:MAG: cation transport protein ChaC [Paracoccaceae bacterium]|jgi:cation transport protein ChaC